MLPPRSGPPDGAKPPKWQTVLLRAGLFALMVFLGLLLLPSPLLFLGGYLIAATLTTFLSGLIANFLSVRIYENFSLLDLGLAWNAAARRHLLMGLGIGAVCAVGVVSCLLITGGATMERSGSFQLSNFLFVTALLALGAAGEELMFRGYGFQFLTSQIGEYATLLPMSVLFGAAHIGNKDMTTLALVNTMAWGGALGYAFLRSRDLWLPMGIHFAWNWVLPLFGAQLSGFTMGVTGIQLKPSPGSVWSGGNYGPEGSVLTSLAVVVVIWYLQRAPVIPQRTAFAPEPEPDPLES